MALGWPGQPWMAAGPRVPGSLGPSQPIAPGLHQPLLVLISSPNPDRLPPRWVLDFSILRGLLRPSHQIKLCPWRLRIAGPWQLPPSTSPHRPQWSDSRPPAAYKHPLSQAHRPTYAHTHSFTGSWTYSVTHPHTNKHLPSQWHKHPYSEVLRSHKRSRPLAVSGAPRLLKNEKLQPSPRICSCSKCLHVTNYHRVF